MKAIILAGGQGTRLRPLTYITNKHLLPVFNKPMIEYSIEIIKKTGFKEIIIITGKESAGDFMNYLGSGRKYGLRFYYGVQDEAGGIAQALGIAEGLCKYDNEGVFVLLGDNIFEYGEYIKEALYKFKKRGNKGAVLFIKKMPKEEVKRFGMVLLDEDRVKEVIEKPQYVVSQYIQTGMYIYDRNVFNIIKKLKPSLRGELEIADVSDWYAKNNQCYYQKVVGFWRDAGKWDTLKECWDYLYLKSKK